MNYVHSLNILLKIENPNKLHVMSALNPRQNKIIDLVHEKDYISVKELGNILDVSLVTIRKDLNLLEKNGYLYRTHGGASKKERFAFEKNIVEKELIQTEAKRRIAQEAAKLIQPRDFISMASGTTILFLAREIQYQESLTVLSNSLGVSMELAGKSNVDIIQLGGRVRKSSASTIGFTAQQMVGQFSTNILFLGVDGIDLDFGISTSNQAEAELNKLMLQNADKVVVLADSTKMNKKGFGKISSLDDVDIIITDTDANQTFLNKLEENGIEVIIAT